MPAFVPPVAPMPLLERLEDDAPFESSEAQVRRTLDAEALRASVRAELMRLLNTRRGAAHAAGALGVLEYGLPDWSANFAARAEDRTALERDIADAIRVFEPRLSQPRVQIDLDAQAPWRLRLRILGSLEAQGQCWPIAFVAQFLDAQLAHLADERLA